MPLAQLEQPFEGRTALLSPFDRLVFDRKRLAELFDYEYILEMYKPKAARRWGYFALPILHGDEFVGKLDAATDRTAEVLRVTAIHEDVPLTRACRRGSGCRDRAARGLARRARRGRVRSDGRGADRG